MKLDKIENLIDQSKPHKYNFEFECGIVKTQIKLREDTIVCMKY